MIPILYTSTEKDFISNGIGRLADATMCTVTEERNGQYELEMEYPITGRHYSDIDVERIILAVPADGKDAQPFRIYEITKPINGIVTIYARHVTYQLNKAVVMPFTAGSAAAAMVGMANNAVGDLGFEMWTDINSQAEFIVEKPSTIRSLLGGKDGSIVDVYGGEYEWDFYRVKLHSARGYDRGVTLRYGKNLKDLTGDTDTSDIYTGIVPYAKYKHKQGDESIDMLLTLPEGAVWGSHASEYPYKMAEPVDMTDKFKDLEEDEEPTAAQLRQYANEYLSSSTGWQPSTNIKVSFVALWQTEEYKNIAPLQRVNLCDVVTVIYTALGINAKLKVVKTEYNVLLDRYDKIELGYLRANLGERIAGDIEDSMPDLTQVNLDLAAINNEVGDVKQYATDQIQALTESTNEALDSFAEALTNSVQTLQDQIDGNITSWFYAGVPTNDDAPASDWETEKEKNQHLGDLYYDTSTGYCYRWQVTDVGDENVYSWSRITDTDVTKALTDAADAKDVADSKRRVFYTQPEPPYDKGDLWVQGSNGDILRCATDKSESGAFSESDWVLASKYTDDTAANAYTDAAAAQAAQDLATAKTDLEAYADNATKLITGGLGGTVVIVTDANGKPQELAILDTDDINTAANVWRWNKNGLGFSSNGYSGTFDTAVTKDGSIVADFVTTGTMSANIIRGGVLTDQNGNITWDLSTGDLTAKALTIDSPYFKLSSSGEITSIGTDNKKMIFDKATISGYKSDGTLSARLEIGDGLFNIAEGALAIQGHVGVSGQTTFIKNIQSTPTTVVTTLSQDTFTTTNFLTSIGLSSSSCTLIGGSLNTTTLTYMNSYGSTSYQTVVTGWSVQPSISYTAPSLQNANTSAGYSGGGIIRQTSNTYDLPLWTGIDTGYVYSKYGLVTSIL